MAPFYVFLGGGLGSLCRYAIGLLFPSASHHGTLLANILACLFLGMVIGIYGKGLFTDHHKVLLATGFCGGFSTFSTLSLELVQLQDTQGFVTAAGHIILSLVLGIAAIMLGLWLASVVMPQR